MSRVYKEPVVEDYAAERCVTTDDAGLVNLYILLVITSTYTALCVAW